MKKHSKLPLRLARETIRRLTAAETARAAGGQLAEITTIVAVVSHYGSCDGGCYPDTAYATTCAATQAPPCL